MDYFYGYKVMQLSSFQLFYGKTTLEKYNPLKILNIVVLLLFDSSNHVIHTGPTLKLRRPVVTTKYAELIELLYLDSYL